MTNGMKRKMKMQATSAAILAQALELSKMTLEHKTIAAERLKQFLIDVQSFTKPLASYTPGAKGMTLATAFGVSTLDIGTTTTLAEVFARTGKGEEFIVKCKRRGALLTTKGMGGDMVITFNGYDNNIVSTRKAKSAARRAVRKAASL